MPIPIVYSDYFESTERNNYLSTRNFYSRFGERFSRILFNSGVFHERIFVSLARNNCLKQYLVALHINSRRP